MLSYILFFFWSRTQDLLEIIMYKKISLLEIIVYKKFSLNFEVIIYLGF